MEKATYRLIESKERETNIVLSQQAISGIEEKTIVEAVKLCCNMGIIPYVEVCEENKHQREEIAQKDEYIRKLEKSLSKKNIEVDDLKDQIIELNEKNFQLKEASTEPPDDFPYQFDCREFANDKGENPKPEWVRNLWRDLYKLACEINDAAQYKIKFANNVAMIFSVLKNSSSIAYRFIGKQVDFVYRWNVNVVNRLEDKKHADKLKCKEKSFNSAVNKLKSIVSWNRLSNEGKHTGLYREALGIKTIIEKIAA